MRGFVTAVAVIGLMFCVSGLSACENCGYRTVRLRRARVRVRYVRPVIAVEVAPVMVEAVVVEPVVVQSFNTQAVVRWRRLARRPALWIR